MKKQVVAAMLAVSLSMSVNTPAWAALVENNAGQVEEKETNEVSSEVNDEAQEADAEEQVQETGEAESANDEQTEDETEQSKQEETLKEEKSSEETLSEENLDSEGNQTESQAEEGELSGSQTNELKEANELCGANASWKLENGVLTISGTGDLYDYGYENGIKKDTPWAKQIDKIESVVIEKGITSIGERTFEHCVNLKSVKISDDVKRIKKSAFYILNIP